MCISSQPFVSFSPPFLAACCVSVVHSVEWRNITWTSNISVTLYKHKTENVYKGVCAQTYTQTTTNNALSSRFNKKSMWHCQGIPMFVFSNREILLHPHSLVYLLFKISQKSILIKGVRNLTAKAKPVNKRTLWATAYIHVSAWHLASYSFNLSALEAKGQRSDDTSK